MWRWLGFAVLLMVTLAALACAGPDKGTDRIIRDIGRDNPLVLCETESHNKEATLEQVKAVREKHEERFFRLPGVITFSAQKLLNQDGRSRVDFIGIIVIVEDRIDWNTLPPFYRIPSCLDGIPVQFDWGYRLSL